jgi:transposase-like protein
MGINREEQGQLIAQLKDAIKRIDDFTYVVKSQSNSGSYNIHSTELGWKCDCADHTNRGVKCKHIFTIEFSFALREQVKKDIVIQPITSVVCRYCNSDSIVKKAIRRNKYGNIQRYLCKECGKRFSFNIGFEKMKYNPHGITTAMQLYFSGESRMSNHTSNEIRRWVPERCIQGRDNANSCCVQCGINHEARDFMRAMLLHLLDHFERNGKFIEFMKDNEFLDVDAYQTMVTNIEKFQKQERNTQEHNNGSISIKEACSHFADIGEENIIPTTSGCEECEKEHTDWVALRLCLTCGHVGCCDSSKGMHATKHFVSTTHPVIVALPDKPWNWCYVDKIYG